MFFIAPNKETIYLDELPDCYDVKSPYTAVDHLVDYLLEITDVRIIYVKNEMLCMKEVYSDVNMYYKSDTHWNTVGTYVGAVSLVKELGIELPSFDEINLKAEPLSMGDLTDMLHISILNGDIKTEVS